MKKIIFYSALVVLMTSMAFFYLKNPTAGETEKAGVQQDCKSPIEVYEDPARIPLKRFVLEEMGDLSGKRIVDIGAGTGFFAFDMASTADYVYATELDPSFLKYMKKKKSELGVKNIEVITAKEDYSELRKLRTDYVLMVYVFHYLENPKEFLVTLKNSISPGGKIFIANSQISPVIIKDYLEMAGFTVIQQSEFFFSQSGCGPVEVQMISASVSEASLTELK